MTEEEMVGWHHQLDGHESEQVLEVGDGEKMMQMVIAAMKSKYAHFLEENL